MKRHNLIKQILIIIIAVSVLSQEACAKTNGVLEEVFNGFSGKYIILVSKHDFSLVVYDRSLKAIKRYTICYGKNPDKKPKIMRGDNRTPEGTYYITEILSMDADKATESYKKLKNMNGVYFKASEGHSLFGHPDKDLGYNAYGPRFYRISYPNNNDMKRYNHAVKQGDITPKNGKLPGTGSGIAIHGNADEKSIGHLSSSGCIRMFNRDVIELEKYIMLGTPVVISP